MKVLSNKIKFDFRRRIGVRPNGEIQNFFDCVICGKPLTTTYYVCDSCTQKYFGGGEFNMNRFIDYVKHYSKKSRDGTGTYFATIPDWAIDPHLWDRKRRNGTL